MRLKFQAGGSETDRLAWRLVAIGVLIPVLALLVVPFYRQVRRAKVLDVIESSLPAKIRPGRALDLSVGVAAQVSEIFVQPGDTVRAGQVLAVLESDEVRMAVEYARLRFQTAARKLAAARDKSQREGRTRLDEHEYNAAVRAFDQAEKRLDAFGNAADADHRAAQERVRRVADLVPQGLATAAELAQAQRDEQAALRQLREAREHLSRLQQEVEEAEAKVRLLEIRGKLSPDRTAEAAASADYDEASQFLQMARQRETGLKIIAPFDGVILNPAARAGERIAAGRPVLTVGDASKLLFEAAVSPAVARRVSAGMAVTLLIPADPPIRVPGHIDSVSLAPDPAAEAYVVRATVTNPAPSVLLVGMEGEIALTHWENLWQQRR